MTSATPPDLRLNDPWTALNITTYVAGIVYLLFLSPLARIVWNLASELAIAIAVTTALRDGRPFWLQAIFVVVTVVLIELLRALALTAARRRGVLEKLGGRPAFKDLELMPLSLFKFLLRCIGGLTFTFDAEGTALMRAIAATDERTIHDALERQYVAKYGGERWPEAWEQIRSTSVDGTTFATAMESGLIGFIGLKRRTLNDVMAVPAVMYFSLSFLLLSDALVRGDPLLLLQVTLVGGLMLSGFSFAQMTVMLRQVQVLDPDVDVITQSEDLLISDEGRARLAEARDDLRGTEAYDALKRHAGAVFLPTVEMRPAYISSVRSLVVQLTFFIMLGAALVCVPLLLLQWAGGVVFSEWRADRPASWSGGMLLGTVLLPLGLSLAVLFGFWLFTQFNRFLALAVTAILAAVVPSVLAYAMGLESPQAIAFTALVTAAVGSIPIAVAELIKKQPAATVPTQLSPSPHAQNEPPNPPSGTSAPDITGRRGSSAESRSEKRTGRSMANPPAPDPAPPPTRPSRPVRRRPPSPPG